MHRIAPILPVLLALVLWSPAAVHAATEIDGRPNNPYGSQFGIDSEMFSDYFTVNCEWAAAMAGEWSHVRISLDIRDTDPENDLRALAMCRAHKLTPIISGLYVADEERDPNGGGDADPYDDLDSYPQSAAGYRTWAKTLADLGVRPLYREIGNEINGKWEPETYGRFIIEMSQALKSELPDLNVVSAGLAGNGADFLGEMLDKVPEAKDHIDFYGLHPYGANHPPAYDLDGYCLRGHEWTREALLQRGVENPRFVMTESGYELNNRSDDRFPRITDALRAEYMVEAYKDYWEPDPDVAALTIFMLHATVYPGWNGWVLIDTRNRKTETYEALRRIQKPRGSDWMPQGENLVSGRVTDAASGLPVERVYAYTLPGVYAAVTDASGNYRIENLPDGEYEVRYFRDGFTSPSAQFVKASPGNKPVHFIRNIEVERIGILSPDFAPPANATVPARLADGWAVLEDQPWRQHFHPLLPPPDEHYSVDSRINRSGQGSQKIVACPNRSRGVWRATGFATAVPDRAWAAEVWVRGKGVKIGERDGKSRDGASLSLAITDTFARPFSTAKFNLPLEGDFGWTPISVTLPPVPEGRRMIVKCELDADEGEVWFDDVYVHYAEYPVPSRGNNPRTGNAVVTGEVHVLDETKETHMQERVPGAAVCLWPGNYWTLAKSDGSFEIENVPPGTYDVFAFHRDWTERPLRRLEVTEAGASEVIVYVDPLPAPDHLLNAGFEERGAEMATLPFWRRFGEFEGISYTGWHEDIEQLDGGVQAHSGEAFAGMLVGSNVGNGGMLQTVEVEPGARYRAGVWIYTWQYDPKSDHGLVGDVANRLGIDPTGGQDPNGPYVLWTPFRPSHNKWSPVTIEAEALSDRMTVFLEAKQILGRYYNLNVFDDVTLEKVEE